MIFGLRREGNKSRKTARFSLVREIYFPSQEKLFSQSGKKFFLGREEIRAN